MNIEQIIRENIDKTVHMSLATVTNWYVFGRFDDEPFQKYKLEWNAV